MYSLLTKFESQFRSSQSSAERGERGSGARSEGTPSPTSRERGAIEPPLNILIELSFSSE